MEEPESRDVQKKGGRYSTLKFTIRMGITMQQCSKFLGYIIKEEKIKRVRREFYIYIALY